ncbi:hypothetical protein GCM10010497_04550 [Streptomyces cinereoruber]|uniref:FXSXX-COOH protein n=1 Tax=Streptomyces cinereoruber TaxID=67260 RepID=A0AAV4K9S0_9ACTN|nr:hypothetical protein CP977_22285 [Streptomyces cinereoruber]GGR06221.1 hypothetical protein GCM10010497_04550 [Streptomyces cinereoruber]
MANCVTTSQAVPTTPRPTTALRMPPPFMRTYNALSSVSDFVGQAPNVMSLVHSISCSDPELLAGTSEDGLKD